MTYIPPKFGMSNIGNTSGTTGTVSRGIVFAGGNNVTLSQSINGASATVSISAANQTLQTSNVHNITLSGNTAGAMAQVSSGTLTLAGGNNITLSQAGNAITISGGAGGGVAIVGGGTTYSTGSANFNASGALTIASGVGQSLNFSVPQTSSISATGALSISTNGNTVSMGVPVQTNQTLGMFAGNNTFFNSTATLDARSLSINGYGGVSVGYTNGSIILSGASGGIGIANSQTTYNSGNANLVVAGGAMTIASTTGQSFNFSVPQTSVFSGTGAISISTNGNTISIGAPAMFNAGISTIGNTSGVSGQNTNGLVLVGGNNITLSQSTNSIGATITVSGGAGGGFSAGMSTNGNTSGVSGFASNQLIFAGGSNVTLSQATAGSGNIITISAGGSAAAPTNFMKSASAAGVTGTTSQYTANSSVAPNPSLAIDNTTAAEGTTSLLVTNLSVGFPYVFITNNATDGASVTPGQTYTATVSVKRGIGNTAQCQAQISFYTSAGAYISNITGSPVNVNSTTFTLLTVTGAAPATAAYAVPQWLTATSVPVNDTFYLDQWGIFDSSYVSGWSLPGAGTSSGGVALANSNTTYTSGTVNIVEGGGAITINSGTGTAQAFSVAVPQLSNLVGLNGITLLTSGNTISISGNNGTGALAARWEAPNAVFSSIGTMANGSLSLQHQYIPYNVQGTAAKIAVSLTVSTFTSATTASANYSLSMGVYTLNGSTLSLMSSGTANNGFSYGNTANAQYTQTITGIRQMTVPMNVNITPGEYWVGALISSASTFASTGMTMMGNNQIIATGVLGVIGSSTSAGRDVYLGQGIYSANTAGLPATIPLTAINNTQASNAMRAAFYHAIYSATY
ncbi:MAG: hypothetical protein ABIQ04_04605 [Candidatus Saccharimonadales bacterium]